MTRMNGLTFGYVILPDMMQVANPLLILGTDNFQLTIVKMYKKNAASCLLKIFDNCLFQVDSCVVSAFIPIFDYGIYPVLSKFYFAI